MEPCYLLDTHTHTMLNAQIPMKQHSHISYLLYFHFCAKVHAWKIIWCMWCHGGIQLILNHFSYTLSTWSRANITNKTILIINDHWNVNSLLIIVLVWSTISQSCIITIEILRAYTIIVGCYNGNCCDYQFLVTWINTTNHLLINEVGIRIFIIIIISIAIVIIIG